MAESNCNDLDINFISQIDDEEEMVTPLISEAYLDSPWYSDSIFVLTHLQSPSGLTKTKARFIKQKAMRFCILNNALYWKENTGLLLNCLLKSEADKILEEFHAGDCGGHLYWKRTVDKILRAGFY